MAKPFVVSSALAALLLLAGCNRDVVAKVGGQKLTRADLDWSAQQRGRSADTQVLQEVVERELLAEGARDRGLDKNAKVRAQLKAAEREVLAQALIESASTGSSDETKLRAAYAANKAKLTKLRVHVAHIVVRPKDSSSEALAAARARANEAYSRAMSGEAFEQVASAFSDDAFSKARGGDLGPILDGQVDPAFFAAAARLKKGEVGQPTQGRFGFEILKALEDPAPVEPPFDQVKGQLAAQLMQEAATALATQLHKEISVKTYPERLSKP